MVLAPLVTSLWLPFFVPLEVSELKVGGLSTSCDLHSLPPDP